MTRKSLSVKTPTRAAKPRWQRRKDARPEEILAAALACFAENGFSNTLLDEVAVRAGIAKGTLYRYFDSKEELLRAVVRANLGNAISAAEANFDHSQSPSAEMLTALIGRLAERVTSPAGVLPHIIFAEAARFPDMARFYVDEVIARALSLTERVIKRGIASGEFRAMDARSAAFCLIAPEVLETLFRNGLQPYAGRSLGVEKLTPTLIDVTLHGLQAAPRKKKTKD